MNAAKHDEICQTVREHYAHITENERCGGAPSCCGGPATLSVEAAQSIGSSAEESSVVSASIEAMEPCGGSCAGSDTESPRIRPAVVKDLGAIKSLLSRCQLPTDDLTEATASSFLVAASGDDILAVCGVEVFGSDGLIRSLAVDPALRGRKLGERLVAENESKAMAAGVKSLYLLTTTARDYMRRLGYEDIARESAPDPVRAHRQFQGLCPASAKCLVKNFQ